MQLRPPSREDADAVLAVMAARDVADIGHPDVTLEDVLIDWSTPGIDPELDCVLAEDRDGRIVGYAFIDHRSSLVLVHPEAEGQGIGTALRERMETRSRERGEPIRQALPAGNASGVAHLQAAGYEIEHSYQRLAASLDDIPPRAPGAGIRPFDLAAEGAAVHALIEPALAEVDGSTDPLDAWRTVVERKSEPPFRLAVDDDEGLAGAVIGERWPDGVGYVAELATARRARGRGYGRSLLLELLHTFRDAGLTRAELFVHGRNLPAFALYASVGMKPSFRMDRWIRRG